MKELTVTKKLKVVKLFLTGLSYDEIAQQSGIAKGSVVNIVNEFREGGLPVPPGMTEYIDELRSLVVDLKKSNTTVSALRNYVKLHNEEGSPLRTIFASEPYPQPRNQRELLSCYLYSSTMFQFNKGLHARFDNGLA